MSKYFIMLDINGVPVPLTDKGETALFSSKRDASEAMVGHIAGERYGVYEWKQYQFNP